MVWSHGLGSLKVTWNKDGRFYALCWLRHDALNGTAVNGPDDEPRVMTSRSDISSTRYKRHSADSDALLTKRLRFTMAENGSTSAQPHLDVSDPDFDPPRLGERNWIDRTEYLRLITQSLNDLGYARLATELEMESNVRHEEQNVVELRLAVFHGDWDKALDLLGSVQLDCDVDRRRARFLLLEEKFLEVHLHDAFVHEMRLLPS